VKRTSESLWYLAAIKRSRSTLLDARLHIIVAVGVTLFGYLFSRCWNAHHFYEPSKGPFCVKFDDVSAFGLFPFKWVIAAAIFVILVSIYRIWSGQNSN
jgi:hypothetical protein